VVQQQAFGCTPGKGLQKRVIRPGRTVADAAQAAVGNRNVPIENPLAREPSCRLTKPMMPAMQDAQSQDPQATCVLVSPTSTAM